METKPMPIPVCYLLTSSSACSVTLSRDKETLTWKPLNKGGQTSVIVPPGYSLQTDEHVRVYPLPRGFLMAE